MRHGADRDRGSALDQSSETRLGNPVRRAWLSMLSRRNTLIRYDARGTGLSDRDRADFSLQRQIEDLEAVVEAAKCDRFALLGLWTGGAVAINYAVSHPERVTHLSCTRAQHAGG